ncbi:MAG: hypothetical protein E7327_07840 [Clostridiales bacterium]|nr:hypothetical protein [Clostridiales bacterium]
MTERELALTYAPVIHFDRGETIPLAAVGYTVFRETQRSDSFPKRMIVPDAGGLVIEYALYWDYDIQHMYDLEHIWVYAAPDGMVSRAECSFHGKYLTLWEPGLTVGMPPEGTHVHAFCQPGKHAFLPEGQLFRLIPGWRECCMEAAGGPVLVGGPFAGAYQSAPETDRRCGRYIREHYAFVPQLEFDEGAEIPERLLQPWERLKAEIPARIAELCSQLNDDETKELSE